MEGSNNTDGSKLSGPCSGGSTSSWKWPDGTLWDLEKWYTKYIFRNIDLNNNRVQIFGNGYIQDLPGTLITMGLYERVSQKYLFILACFQYNYL